jgi:hypothetical protein
VTLVAPAPPLVVDELRRLVTLHRLEQYAASALGAREGWTEVLHGPLSLWTFAGGAAAALAAHAALATPPATVACGALAAAAAVVRRRGAIPMEAGGLLLGVVAGAVVVYVG